MDYDVNLEYNKSYISNKKLNISYDVSVRKIDAKKNIETKELKKRITNIIPEKDRKYIDIKSFTKKNAVLEFNSDKWFKDVVKETLVETPDRFEKIIKIGEIPSIINNSNNPLNVSSIIEQSFRNYLNSNKKFRTKIETCVKTAVKKLSVSYFTFNYDAIRNGIIISLKPEFRINPLLFVKPIEEVKKINFDNSVKSLLKLK